MNIFKTVFEENEHVIYFDSEKDKDIFKNLYYELDAFTKEELIGKITDLQMNSKILKSYLYSYKNNPDHFEDIIVGAPDYYDFWYDEDDRIVRTPMVMDKTKEKSFFKQWKRKYKKGIKFKFHPPN